MVSITAVLIMTIRHSCFQSPGYFHTYMKDSQCLLSSHRLYRHWMNWRKQIHLFITSMCLQPRWKVQTRVWIRRHGSLFKVMALATWLPGALLRFSFLKSSSLLVAANPMNNIWSVNININIPYFFGINILSDEDWYKSVFVGFKSYNIYWI